MNDVPFLQKTYRLKWYRVLPRLLGLPLVLFCASTAADVFLQPQKPYSPLMLASVLCGGAYGLYALLQILCTRLVIEGDHVAYSTVAKTVRFTRDDILGWQFIPGRGKIPPRFVLLLRDEKDDVVISGRGLNLDDDFARWLQSLPGSENADRLLREKIRAGNFGDGKEVHRRLRQNRIVLGIFALSLFAHFGLAVWGQELVDVYGWPPLQPSWAAFGIGIIFWLMQLLLPLAGIIGYADIFISIFLAVIGISVFNVYLSSALSYVHFYDAGYFFGGMVVLAAIFFAAPSLLSRPRPSLFLGSVTFLFLMLFVQAGCLLVNVAFDRAAPVARQEMRILCLGMTESKSPRPYADYMPYADATAADIGNCHVKLNASYKREMISRALYQSLYVGDRFCLNTYPGRLGNRWQIFQACDGTAPFAPPP